MPILNPSNLPNKTVLTGLADGSEIRNTNLGPKFGFRHPHQTVHNRILGGSRTYTLQGRLLSHVHVNLPNKRTRIAYKYAPGS